jgi:hypothetical protein
VAKKCSNETHASTTDPEARLYRKGPGKEAKLCFIGHALMENRNGLIVDACLTEANGHADRIAALHMIEPRADRPRPITLGADKARRGFRQRAALDERDASRGADGHTTKRLYSSDATIRRLVEQAYAENTASGRIPVLTGKHGVQERAERENVRAQRKKLQEEMKRLDARWHAVRYRRTGRAPQAARGGRGRR